MNLALAYSFSDFCGERRKLGELLMHKDEAVGTFYGRKGTGLFKSSCRVRNPVT